MNNSVLAREVLPLLAPYIAVLIGMYYLQSVWLSLLLYHFQIIFYAKCFHTNISKIFLAGFSKKYFLLFVVPLLLFGPLLYFVFPFALREHVSIVGWLSQRGIVHKNFMILIPYFCTVHPILEELHWSRYREQYSLRQWFVPVLFSGYHLLVLWELLNGMGLIACFIALVGVACIWDYLHKKLAGGLVPLLLHALGDVGIMGAAYLFFCNS